MGLACCKSGKDKWPKDFTATDLSSNKCDAEWEDVIGEQATFGMGSHWGPCARFGGIPGVVRVRVGFTGGAESEPNYNDPKDHTEAVNLQYNPDQITYKALLQVFWDYHDWTLQQDNPQYASMIYYHDDRQKLAAETSLMEMNQRTQKPIRTKVSPYNQFWISDDEFQHHLLQQQKKAFTRLKIPVHQLAQSHLACKAEGYVCGYAKPEQFDDEVAELYLPTDLAAFLRKMCVTNQPPEEGADKFPVK